MKKNLRNAQIGRNDGTMRYIVTHSQLESGGYMKIDPVHISPLSNYLVVRCVLRYSIIPLYTDALV